MAVFPEAKLFSTSIFRVKNEFQNWNPEFASHYGLPVGAAGTGTGSPAGRVGSTGHRPRPPATATGCGHRLRPGLPARIRLPATHGRTDRHRHGKAPATVETWQSAGTVAAGIKQKAGNPEGKPARENGRQLSAAVGLG